jgi:hypothetical protein
VRRDRLRWTVEIEGAVGVADVAALSDPHDIASVAISDPVFVFPARRSPNEVIWHRNSRFA